MAWFWRKESTQVGVGEGSETYFESYGRMVARIHTVGGFPLTVFVVAVLVVIVALVSVVMNALADLVPYLLAFSSVLAILGIVVYVLELRTKQSLLHKSMDGHQSLVDATFKKYLESKETFSDNDVKATMKLIDELLRTRVAEARKAIVPPHDLPGAGGPTA